MKLIISLLLLVLHLPVMALDIAVQGRVAAYFPEDKNMRRVYDDAWPEYEIEVSTPLNLSCCDPCTPWELWSNFNYWERKGNSTCLNNRTRIDHYTVLIGAKYFFDLSDCGDCCGCFSWSSLRPYLGLGGGAAYVKFRDHSESEFIKHHNHRAGGSLLLKSGIQYDFCNCMFADIFLDYAWNWFRFRGCDGDEHRKRTLQTGGLKLGLGLGYRF
jgi:hypothetical protein